MANAQERKDRAPHSQRSALNLKWPKTVEYSQIITDGTGRDMTSDVVALVRSLEKVPVNNVTSLPVTSNSSPRQTQTRPDIYGPLDPGHIRLLYLRKGDKNSRLVGRLVPVDIGIGTRRDRIATDGVIPEYDALSYTWAGENNSDVRDKSIAFHGSAYVLPITSNCNAALRTLRQPDRVIKIWVDSISINQVDDDEKNQQVALMHEIYSKACQVHVYLGRPKKEEEEEMDFDMSDEGMDINEEMYIDGGSETDGGWLIEGGWDSDEELDIDEDMVTNKDMDNIRDKEIDEGNEIDEERITNQDKEVEKGEETDESEEIGMRKETDGDRKTDEEDEMDKDKEAHDVELAFWLLDQKPKFFETSKEQRASKETERRKLEKEKLKEWRRVIKALFLRRYFERVWIIQEVALAKIAVVHWGKLSISWHQFEPEQLKNLKEIGIEDAIPGWVLHCGSSKEGKKEKEIKDLDSILFDVMSSQASDSRDKVFALLGMIPGAWPRELRPDYELSMEQVYVGIAAYLATHHSLRAVLRHANSLHHAGNIRRSNIPRQANGSISLATKDDTYEDDTCKNLPSWVPDFRQAVDGISLLEPRIARRFPQGPFKSQSRIAIHAQSGSLIARGHRLLNFVGKKVEATENNYTQKVHLSQDTHPETTTTAKVHVSFQELFQEKEDFIFLLNGQSTFHFRNVGNGCCTLVGECTVELRTKESLQYGETLRSGYLAETFFALKDEHFKLLWNLYHALEENLPANSTAIGELGLSRLRRIEGLADVTEGLAEYRELRSMEYNEQFRQDEWIRGNTRLHLDNFLSFWEYRTSKTTIWAEVKHLIWLVETHDERTPQNFEDLWEHWRRQKMAARTATKQMLVAMSELAGGPTNTRTELLHHLNSWERASVKLAGPLGFGRECRSSQGVTEPWPSTTATIKFPESAYFGTKIEFSSRRETYPLIKHFGKTTNRLSYEKDIKDLFSAIRSALMSASDTLHSLYQKLPDKCRSDDVVDNLLGDWTSWRERMHLMRSIPQLREQRKNLPSRKDFSAAEKAWREQQAWTNSRLGISREEQLVIV